MSITQALAALAADEKLAAALALLAVDVVLGIGGSFYNKTFSLAYVSDFLGTDVLRKFIPWGVVYAIDKVTHGAGIDLGPLGVDTGDVAMTFYGLMTLALLGSITNSLAVFGVSLPVALSRGEKTDPAVPPAPAPEPKRSRRVRTGP
jgi:hypothetical protein